MNSLNEINSEMDFGRRKHMNTGDSQNGFLQGDLQALFDALYSIGAIDPVLKMDWSEVNNERAKNHQLLQTAVSTINACASDPQLLLEKMHALDSKSLSFIAVEVAREYAEFQDRKELH
jgi:hypothetical protein